MMMDHVTRKVHKRREYLARSEEALRVLVTLLRRPLLKRPATRPPTQPMDMEEEVALAIIALSRIVECGVLEPLLRLRGVEAALARVVWHPAPLPPVWHDTWKRFTGPESGHVDWKLSNRKEQWNVSI